MKKGLIFAGVIVFLFVLLLVFGAKKEDTDESLKVISMNEYNEKISNKDDFVLVISQDGCSHCEEFLPIVRKVAKDYNITIYNINMTTLSNGDQNIIASTYNLRSTPTTVFIKKGKETSATSRILSNITEEKFVEKLKEQKFIK